MKAARHGGAAPRASSSRFDPGHGGAEILCLARPSRRIDARRAVERLDAKPGIVGERHQARGARGGARFKDGVVAEGRPRLLGLVEAEGAGADRLDAEGSQQFVDLAQLAGIMGGDDEASGKAPARA